jgi:hypothetical protein
MMPLQPTTTTMMIYFYTKSLQDKRKKKTKNLFKFHNELSHTNEDESSVKIVALVSLGLNSFCVFVFFEGYLLRPFGLNAVLD